MFCDYCGEMLEEVDLYCGSCGSRTKVKQILKCEGCGAHVTGNSKYCNVCGTETKFNRNTKLYCAYCGTQFTEEDSFCRRCGHSRSQKLFSFASAGNKKGGKSDFCPPVELRTKSAEQHTSVSMIPSGGEKLPLLHMILAGLFALLLILSFLPTFTVDGLFDTNDSLSIARLGSELYWDALEAEILFGFLALLSVGICIFMTVKPVMNHLWNPAPKYTWQKCVLIIGLVCMFLLYVAVRIYMEEEAGMFSEFMKPEMAFGGVMYIVVDLAALILIFYAESLNKPHKEND